MVLVIFENGLETAADAIVAKFTQEYNAKCAIAKVAPDAVRTRRVEWDDLLIVAYRSAKLSATLEAYVRAHRDAHPYMNPDTGTQEPGSSVIPVCATARLGERTMKPC